MTDRSILYSIKASAVEALLAIDDALVDSEYDDDVSLLRAKIATTDVKVRAITALSDMDYRELTDQMIGMQGEIWDLEAEKARLETEIGSFRLKERTETPLDTDPDELSIDEYEFWPTWLLFKKGDIVADTVSKLEGTVVGWRERNHDLRVEYLVSFGGPHPVHILPEELIGLEPIPVPEPGEFYPFD